MKYPGDKYRKIIHVDMDAFYASVEQRDHPEYKGKPLAVGGSSERGVVAAASYEARKYGVHSAMPSVIAARKCPELIFVKPNFKKYKEVSKDIFDIFQQFTDLVEPLSIDEAFLDVTANKKNLPSATLIAKEIKKLIKEKVGLTASAGISFNKFLAKIASDYRKPDGLFVIPPEKATGFIATLPIEKFFGVGEVTAKKMHKLGIHSGADLRTRDENFLTRHFGKVGLLYYNMAKGTDERLVNPHRIRKSVGTEYTFHKDLNTMFEVTAELYKIEKELWERIERNQAYGRTLTLKIKFNDFKQITKSKTLQSSLENFSGLHQAAKDLVSSTDVLQKPVRLLGLSISNLKYPGEYKAIQLTLDF